MINNYMDEYLKKIKLIIFKFITYYDNFEISLSEFPHEGNYKYKEFELKVMDSRSYDEIDKMITYIVEKDIAKINILFPEQKMLFHIGGFFVFNVFGENTNFLNDLKPLVYAENLFFTQLSG